MAASRPGAVSPTKRGLAWSPARAGRARAGQARTLGRQSCGTPLRTKEHTPPRRAQALRPGVGGGRDGSARVTFEDKPLLSDVVFLRAWVAVELPRLYNPLTDLLAPAPPPRPAPKRAAGPAARARGSPKPHTNPMQSMRAGLDCARALLAPTAWRSAPVQALQVRLSGDRRGAKRAAELLDLINRVTRACSWQVVFKGRCGVFFTVAQHHGGCWQRHAGHATC